jgi:hypothetical protein
MPDKPFFFLPRENVVQRAVLMVLIPLKSKIIDTKSAEISRIPERKERPCE